jgi:hypothetical protein
MFTDFLIAPAGYLIYSRLGSSHLYEELAASVPYKIFRDFMTCLAVTDYDKFVLCFFSRNTLKLYV